MISSDWRSQNFEKKKLVVQIWANGPKLGHKLGFFVIFSISVH